jgi:hypothetical protein
MMMMQPISKLEKEDICIVKRWCGIVNALSVGTVTVHSQC